MASKNLPTDKAASKNLPTSHHSDVLKEERPSPFSIEGIRSGAVQSKLVKFFLILSGLVLAFGLFLTGLGPTDSGLGAPPSGDAAQVGNQSISNAQLARTFEQQQQFYEQYGQKTTPLTYFSAKQGALKQLTDNAALVEAARAQNIEVTDADVDKKIDELIGEQLQPQAGQSQAAFRRIVETRFGSMQEAREQVRESFDRDLVREALLVEKLEKSVKDANRVGEDDYKKANTKLTLRQLVVRAETPKPGAKDPVAEQKKLSEAAEKEAAKIFAELKKNPTAQTFAAQVKQHSDDETTKNKGGQIGAKLPSEFATYGPTWPEKMANATGKLIGPLADQIGSQYIFFVEGRKLELPKDYAKNKKKLLEEFETQRDTEAWNARREELTKGLTPQVSDPALAAYQLTSAEDFYSKTPAEQKELREQAVERYEAAMQNAAGVEKAAIAYQQAQLYRDLNQPQERLAALGEAVKAGENVPELRLEYARALKDAKKNTEAIEQLKLTSKSLDENPPAPSMFGGDPSSALRQQLAGEFKALNQPKLAEAETKKIQAAPQGMGGLPPGMQIMPGQ